MVWTALGDALPLAIAIGVSPFAVITAVVLLMGDGGRLKASTFAVGWSITIAVITAIAVVFAQAAVDADAELAEDGIDVLNVVLGIGFLAVAMRSWRNRSAQGEASGLTRLLDRIAAVGPLGAFGFGLLQGVVVVKSTAPRRVEGPWCDNPPRITINRTHHRSRLRRDDQEAL